MKNINEKPLMLALAGGGTGGHLFPMLSVAAEILKRRPTTRFLSFTTQRPIDERSIHAVLPADRVRIIPQPVQPWPRSIMTAIRFWTSWRSSLRNAQRILKDQRPDLVLGSGGFGCAPSVVAAARMGIPTALLNPDAKPGIANRLLSVRADVVFTQWPASEMFFPRSARVLSTGCPVRPAFAKIDRAAGIARFGLDAKKRTLLITGASQGARSINQAILASLDQLAAQPCWQFIHVTGTDDESRVCAAYVERGLPAQVLAYTEHMHEAMSVADLVVSRAGASSLAELTALGKPGILLPYPFDRHKHQYDNAAMLTDAGAAKFVEDRADAPSTAKELSRALTELMDQPDRLEPMARASAELGRQNAVEKITDYLLALADRCSPNSRSKSKKPLHNASVCVENEELRPTAERNNVTGTVETDSVETDSVEAAA